jgi:hypothetical protein
MGKVKEIMSDDVFKKHMSDLAEDGGAVLCIKVNDKEEGNTQLLASIDGTVGDLSGGIARGMEENEGLRLVILHAVSLYISKSTGMVALGALLNLLKTNE